MTIDIFLILIIAGLIIERYFINQQFQAEKEKLLQELSKAIKAVISKNANEYIMTTSIDKVPEERQEEPNSDIIAEEELSDEEFDEALGIKREPPK